MRRSVASSNAAARQSQSASPAGRGRPTRSQKNRARARRHSFSMRFGSAERRNWSRGLVPFSISYS
jgi:hypothetical protein